MANTTQSFTAVSGPKARIKFDGAVGYYYSPSSTALYRFAFPDGVPRYRFKCS
jgi:hypothetical protein